MDALALFLALAVGVPVVMVVAFLNARARNRAKEAKLEALITPHAATLARLLCVDRTASMLLREERPLRQRAFRRFAFLADYDPEAAIV